MNTTINTFTPAFQGELILNEKTIVHRELANLILENEILQDFAQKSDKDIFVSQSSKYARNNAKAHYKNELLYKIFLSKEDNSFVGKIKQFLGLNKVSLSKNYHTPQTFYSFIIQPSHLKKITQKLSLK